MKTSIGFPYPSFDPMQFLVDDEIKAFEFDERHDLTGTGIQACPILSTGVFIVHKFEVPKNTAMIVLNIFPHCWARTGVGSETNASAQVLPPDDVAGFVLFDHTRNDGQPYVIQNNYNKPTIAASPNDRDRDIVSGKTWLAPSAPLLQSSAMQNPLTAIYCKEGTTFRVVFRLAPTAPTNGIPNPYQIGTGENRIDFAGALVTGVQMPQQLYDDLKKARRNGLLGV